VIFFRFFDSFIMARVGAGSALLSVAMSATMDCGSGVPLCGVLTLESGYGTGYYEHAEPSVHGLWPETGSYGTSQCIAPGNSADPSELPSCYATTDDVSHQLDFVTHEWDKHGSCAGVADVADYFGQICSLSAPPLQVMSTVRSASGDFTAMKTALVDAGYPVWSEDGQSEVLLSACAKSDGRWKLAKVADFQSVCFDSTPGPSPVPSPVPSPSPSAGHCYPNEHGPACSSDADCDGVVYCVRCAHSGYCTDVPLSFQI